MPQPSDLQTMEFVRLPIRMGRKIDEPATIGVA
jgi:hypothetical protein